MKKVYSIPKVNVRVNIVRMSILAGSVQYESVDVNNGNSLDKGEFDAPRKSTERANLD